MKRIKQLAYYVLAAFLLTACQSYKKVPYLQDAEVVLYSTQDAQLYDAKIMPKDLLTIVVSCTSPELAAPFNLTVATQGNTNLSSTTTLFCSNIWLIMTVISISQYWVNCMLVD